MSIYEANSVLSRPPVDALLGTPHCPARQVRRHPGARSRLVAAGGCSMPVIVARAAAAA
jgi:hypothetical protein